MSEIDSRLVCNGCGATISDDEAFPWRCPNARRGDDIDHLVYRELELGEPTWPEPSDASPFVRYRTLLYSYHLARSRGMSDGVYVALVEELDRAVADVDGRGFVMTPLVEAPTVARELGVAEVLVKDETGNVAGSHKARHLMGLALTLAVRERVGLEPGGRPLAIASCGNAALAAAVMARAMERELHVFVPDWAEDAVLARLRELGAALHVCERLEDGPPGDPCTHAFRSAVDDGALPFTCQGSENGLVIEGGETLGWELVDQFAERGSPELDRLFVQVGGGALASAVVAALADGSYIAGFLEWPRVHAVQTEGGHPLHRAWHRLAREIWQLFGGPTAPDDAALAQAVIAARGDERLLAAVKEAVRHRSRYMWPWETAPASRATGILDDETYDWHSVVRSMIATGGWPVVASEAQIEAAAALGAKAIDGTVSPTGTAGLAGAMALRDAGLLGRNERIVLLFTGAQG